MFKCPLCKMQAVLARPPVEVLKDEGHQVLSGGQVSPSVVCANPGCTFHEMVELEGFRP